MTLCRAIGKRISTRNHVLNVFVWVRDQSRINVPLKITCPHTWVFPNVHDILSLTFIPGFVFLIHFRVLDDRQNVQYNVSICIKLLLKYKNKKMKNDRTRPGSVIFQFNFAKLWLSREI